MWHFDVYVLGVTPKGGPRLQRKLARPKSHIYFCWPIRAHEKWYSFVGFILKGDNGHLSISVSLYNVLLLHIAPHEDYYRTPYDVSLFSFTFSSEVSSKLSEGGDFTNAHLLALKLQFFTVDWKVLTIKVASPPIDPIVSVFSSNDRRAIYYFFIVPVFRPSAYVLQTVPFIGSSKGNHQNHRGLFH